jgi:hypothetical protein
VVNRPSGLEVAFKTVRVARPAGNQSAYGFAWGVPRSGGFPRDDQNVDVLSRGCLFFRDVTTLCVLHENGIPFNGNLPYRFVSGHEILANCDNFRARLT